MASIDDIWAIIGHGVTGALISAGATLGSYLIELATKTTVWDPSLNLKVILLMMVVAILKGLLKVLEPEVPPVTGAKAAPPRLRTYFGL